MDNKFNAKVSVVMTTYNHEKYVEEAISSILMQTHTQLELIIVDDGSTDQTRNIISQYDDSRIKRIFKFNEGPSIAMNKGVEIASGDWIALMSGDDISETNRLEIQLKAAMNSNSDLVFSLPTLIDEAGNVLNDSSFSFFYEDIPDQAPALYKKLFVDGNFLCAPTLMIKKDCFIKLGGFVETSIQLQDYLMWISASMNYKIKVLKTRLLRYRLHSNNLSSAEKSTRISLENIFAYKHFFDHVEWVFLKSAFKEVSFMSKDDKLLFECEKAFLLLRHERPLVQFVGFEMMYELMQDEHARKLINKFENFNLGDFFSLASKLNVSIENK